ncbi:ROK family transcriptional regulator (plasmid) [Thioclava sp. 'Guangxiensis']|uniref:ROK family transcriptional regulator n=1 Tax=Thioclava sp. 'Guangxiensis' TaxID=3149044 RepID=UPI003877B2C5
MNDHDPLHDLAPRFRRDPALAQVASANERLILRAIRRAPGIARAGLQFDLTQQSIHRLVTHLAERGLISLGDLLPPSGKGKPSPALHLNPHFCATLGFALNTDSLGVTVMDMGGGHRTASLAITGMTMEEVLTLGETHARAMLLEAGFTWDDLLGIGFAIAGFRVEGTRFNPPEPLAEWAEPHLGPMLTQRWGKPVWAENGANTGALCELMLGIGREVSDFVYMSFNYGFGGGIVMDGRLMRGRYGNAGELSGMFSPEESVDRPALRGLLNDLQAQGVDCHSIQDLSQRFSPEWPGVADWVDRVSRQQTRIINSLHSVIDPEVIVFGGQVPKALAAMLLDRVESWHRPRLGHCRSLPRLEISDIGGETAAIGAAALPLAETIF